MRRPMALGLVRGVLAVAAGVAVLVAAPGVDTTWDLAPALPQPDSPLVPGPREVPVEAARLSCFTAARTYVAPREALTGLPLSDVEGDTLLRESAGGTPDGWVLATGQDATSVLAGGIWAPVRGSTAVSYDACGTPQRETWLVAGGAGAGRREQLRLGNPGVVPTTVDIEVLSTAGTVSPVGARALVVAPGTVRVVDLDALVPGAESPAVHITASAGGVVATVAESWRDGTRLRGAEAVAGTAAPASVHVIPGVLPASRTVLRVAAPGDRPASVSVSVLTAAGELPYDAEPLVVRAGGTAELVLADLPKAPVGLRLSSDEPVVAGVLLEEVGARADDFAWLTVPGPVTVLAGAALGDVDVDYDPLLVMSATAAATVEVTWVDHADELHTRSVDIRGGHTGYLRLPRVAAVWMTSTTPEVHATVVTREVGERRGRVTAMGLTSRPVAVTMEVPAPAVSD